MELPFCSLEWWQKPYVSATERGHFPIVAGQCGPGIGGGSSAFTRPLLQGVSKNYSGNQPTVVPLALAMTRS